MRDRAESQGDRELGRDAVQGSAHDSRHESGQVLQFRPLDRRGDRLRYGLENSAGDGSDADSELLDDLAQYEQDKEEDDNVNYRHRMLMNAIAVAVLTVLMGLGIWLADTIAQMERDQDCVLQGRQNCAPIVLAAPKQK